MKTQFAYLLNDQSWPPTLYQVVDHHWPEDPDRETYTLKQPQDPGRVLWVPAADVWVIAAY